MRVARSLGDYEMISSVDFEGETDVAGGCQLFRRQCFEDVGGYIPNPAGGIDWIAVTTAQMKGWRTRSFPQKQFHHHRTLGTAGKNRVAASFSYGEKDKAASQRCSDACRLLLGCTMAN
jgi:hypothetical protein